MARKYLMTWEGHPNFRWSKLRRRVRHRVTCEELGVPKSKEESYQAANQWWKKRIAELEVASIDPDKQEAVNMLDRKLRYAAAHAPDLVAGLKQTLARVAAEEPSVAVLDDQTVIEKNLQIARLMGVTVPADLDPTVLQHLFGNRRLWQERLKRSSLVEKHKTVGHNLAKFLEEQRLRQKPATHAELSEYLNKVTEYSNVWTAESDVASISEQTVTDHYIWLTSKKFAPSQHNKFLGFFRRFVVWLWAQKQIEEMPRNLKRKEHRKKKVHKEVKKFTGVAEVIAALPSRFRLWAMLGLNCGMTNADLGQTQWSQIDKERWTLTRRRAKTGDNPNTPTVTYKLWPETIALLKELPTSEGLLFVTKNRTPLHESRYTEDGETRQKDMFATYWNKLKPKPAISLGKFRSVAVSALRQDKVFRQYEDYFLAHAPRTLADQHYGAEADGPFFEATDFIRTVVLKPETKKAAPQQKRRKAK